MLGAMFDNMQIGEYNNGVFEFDESTIGLFLLAGALQTTAYSTRHLTVGLLVRCINHACGCP